MIVAVSDKTLLKTKRDVIRLHLYLKFLERGIRPLEKDMELILELFEFGGYMNKEEQDDFIHLCLEKEYRKSEQSVRNTLSKYVSLGVFKKSKNTKLKVSEDFIPSVDCNKIVLKYIVSHAD